MTVQKMDISLNISTTPTFPSRSAKHEQKIAGIEKNCIERLKKPALGRGIAESEERASSTLNSCNKSNKKRVKQKSLAAIFSKRQRSSGEGKQQSRNNRRVQVLASTSVETCASDTQDVESTSIASSCHKRTANEPSTAFSKIDRNSISKTLLAKARRIDSAVEKKSLSEIFRATGDLQTRKPILLKCEQPSLEESSSSLGWDTFQVSRSSEWKHLKRNGRCQKKASAVESRDQATATFRRSAGKISSLFGNNPEIRIVGQKFVKPVNEVVFSEIDFSDLDIHPFTVANLKQNMNITKMTTVQRKAIPQIFQMKDILIRSQTGSGKTLAYALPVVELLHRIRPKLLRGDGVRALVVVPTRELALQTYECFQKLVKPFTWIVPGYLVGGEKRKAEKARLRKGCTVLIATPGRLLDHIKHTEALRLNDVQYFILDEADRMLDMGYERDVSEIVNTLKVADYNPTQLFRESNKTASLAKMDVEGSKPYACEGNGGFEMRRHSKTVDIDNSTESGKKRRQYHSDSESDPEGASALVARDVAGRTSLETCVALNSAESPEKLRQLEGQGVQRCSSSGRKTILLSATLTQAVEKLAGLAMESPVFVDAAKDILETIGGDLSEVNEDLVVPQSVMQTYVVVPPKLRMVTLSAYIAGKCQKSGQHKILIFMATQDMVDYHAEILSCVLTRPINEEDEDSDPLVDVEFFKLHGNMTHADRTGVFKTFRQRKTGVLLCTDVAARGLDLPKVDSVVQYTGPVSARDYVHRIGRTARAGSAGSATIFLTPAEVEFVRELESRRIRISQENMDDVLEHLLGPLSKHNSAHGAAIALQNDFETLLVETKSLRDKAYKAYASWLRFYSSYPREMRDIFNRKALHLGHYAKSFALREPPQRIGGYAKKLMEKEQKLQRRNRLSSGSSIGAQQKRRNAESGDARARTSPLKKLRSADEVDTSLVSWNLARR